MTEYPLFPAKTLAQIPVSDKPPRQDGTVVHLTPKEFEDTYGCKYTENLWGTKEQAIYYNKLWTDGLKDTSKLTQLERDVLHRLDNPFQDFVISFINKKVGMGVFASNPIPAGTVIGIYSGVLTDKYNVSPKDVYIYSAEKTHDSITDNSLAISARLLGGVTRFLQHLPINGKVYRAALIREFKNPENLAKRLNLTQTELEMAYKDNRLSDNLIDQLIEEEVNTANLELNDITFYPEELRNSIATTNITARVITLFGCPIIAMCTSIPIEKGEQLGTSYNKYYWRLQNEYPELFTRDGLMLDHAYYKRSKVYLKFVDPTNKSRNFPMEDNTPTFIKDIQRNKPIYAAISKQESISLSVYDLRDKLVKANAVGERYGILPKANLPDFFNNEFCAKFPSISIKAYFQQPTASPATPQGQIIDIICKVKSVDQLNELKSFFAPLKDCIASFNETNELVIIDIAKNKEKISKFITELDPLAKAKKLYTVACDQFNNGKYSESVNTFLKTSTLHKDGSKEQATCFYSLASCYIKQDNYAKAIEFATKAVELRVVLLKNSEITQLDLERAQTKLSDAEALEKADKVAKIAHECFGKNQYQHAADNYLNAIDIHKSTQKEKESVRLSIYYYNLASCYDRQNIHDKAKEYCQLAYNMRLKLLGKDNEYTKKAADKLVTLENKINPATMTNNNPN